MASSMNSSLVKAASQWASSALFGQGALMCSTVPALTTAVGQRLSSPHVCTPGCAHWRSASTKVDVEALLSRPRRAYAVTEAKSPLKLWSYTHATPMEPGEVEVRVTHNGLCHTDVHMRDNDWGASAFPFIPGHEVVGEVVAKGPQVKGFQLGQRVGMGWIKDSCRCCTNCLRGDENLCIKGYTGLITGGGYGGFQELMRVPADFLCAVPDKMDSAVAAPLLCAGITVYAPLRRHITRPGMKVAVVGVGGLGHLAVQYAAKMGAEVTGIDLHDAKAAEAKALGCHHFRKFSDAFKGEPFDILLNTVSAKLDFKSLMGLVKVDGKLVQVGLPAGNAEISVGLTDLVFGQKTVVGSIVGGRADMQEMMDFSALHGVKPVLEIMPLSKVNEAMKRVSEDKARYRIVLTTDFA